MPSEARLVGRVALVSELARLGREHLRPLEERFELVERHALDGVGDERALVDGLQGAWGVVAGSETYTQNVLGGLPGLRIIARVGVGVDAIDLAAATAGSVAVTTTPGANADGVADLTMALLLACLRRIVSDDRSVRAGEWRPSEVSGDLTGATVGLVGLGRIGQKVACRLQGFDCQLLATESHPDREFCHALAVELVELDTLLERADVVSIHLPLTSETRGLIGRRELSLIRPSAVLINTSRGGIVDEPALVEALAATRLAGAGLDVFAEEPVRRDHPLATLENVVLSPHRASFSRLSVARMLAATIESLNDAAGGNVPEGCVNPAAWGPA